MPLTVNSNIASLNAQRNLQRSSAGLNKALERLSSGLRINRAGDDAAGLSISEGLRSQIRGLTVAARNANDGLSLIGTAESAIGAYTDMLQRIRELAVQAVNDTNSAANRAALQEEATQLLEEMTRIAGTVEFNGTKLLDGSFTSKQLQVGANAGETISINTGDLRTGQIGAVAAFTGTGNVDTANIIGAGDLLIDGIEVGAPVADGVSFKLQQSSAIAIVNAINAIGGETGVIAQAEATVRTADASTDNIDAINIDGTTNTFLLNGVDIGAVNVLDNDSDSALRDKINEFTNATGVVATVVSDQLVLTAADGRNITVTTTGSIADELGFRAAASDGDIDSTTGGNIKLSADSAFVISGANADYAGFASGTTAVSVDDTTAINRLSISTSSDATDALIRLDNALRQVNRIRSSLGAITNRLEVSIQNMQATAENLAASDSRIRDADFAAETAALTKNQILQQAGISILAQANATPQAVLQLLQ